jgi:Arc/MetJ-type ribon-helix-helix transcriptional regulator
MAWTGPRGPEWGAGMTIHLKPEQERIIQAEIASGHFHSPDEVLDHALAALKEKEHNRKGGTRRKNLAQFLMESPLAGAELNLERQKDYGRPIEL